MRSWLCPTPSVVDTLARIGMTCDTTKLNLQHFMRHHSDKKFPSLVVDVYGKRVTIAAPKSMRWLRIFFDRHLSFHKHAKIMAARAKTVVNRLRCHGNTVRGLSQASMRVLYRTRAFPILTYAPPFGSERTRDRRGWLSY